MPVWTPKMRFSVLADFLVVATFHIIFNSFAPHPACGEARNTIVTFSLKNTIFTSVNDCQTRPTTTNGYSLSVAFTLATISCRYPQSLFVD